VGRVGRDGECIFSRCISLFNATLQMNQETIENSIGDVL